MRSNETGKEFNVDSFPSGPEGRSFAFHCLYARILCLACLSASFLFFVRKTLSPLLPLILLLLGAGGLLFGLRPRFRYTGLIAIIATLAALIDLLVVGFRLPAQATLSGWGPAPLRRLGLTLGV